MKLTLFMNMIRYMIILTLRKHLQVLHLSFQITKHGNCLFELVDKLVDVALVIVKV